MRDDEPNDDGTDLAPPGERRDRRLWSDDAEHRRVLDGDTDVETWLAARARYDAE